MVRIYKCYVLFVVVLLINDLPITFLDCFKYVALGLLKGRILHHV